MPVLIVEHSGRRHHATLNGRASIGRTPENDLVIDHSAVSRMHAVIECIDGAYYITDSGSKNGTIIGDEPITEQRMLIDGDRIMIGPAILTFRAEEDFIDDSERSPLSDTHIGSLMDCECGAKLWIPKEMFGGRGQCQKCGRTIILGPDPTPDPAAAPAAALSTDVPRVATSRVCSICQWKIDKTDPQHTCPACGLQFHEDCWHENRGCSAYGCAQVNILDKPEEVEAVMEEIGHPPNIATHVHRFPYEYAFLAASVVASLLGLLVFGVTALFTMVMSGLYLLRQGRKSRVAVLLAAMGISLAGLIAGILVSCFWWLELSLHRR